MFLPGSSDERLVWERVQQSRDIPTKQQSACQITAKIRWNTRLGSNLPWQKKKGMEKRRTVLFNVYWISATHWSARFGSHGERMEHVSNMCAFFVCNLLVKLNFVTHGLLIAKIINRKINRDDLSKSWQRKPFVQYKITGKNFGRKVWSCLTFALFDLRLERWKWNFNNRFSFYRLLKLTLLTANRKRKNAN